ncbi:MAG: family 10 glycosylhydrolase [Bacteroidota bacterium]
MDKRKFLKSALIGGMVLPDVTVEAAVLVNETAPKKTKIKHWVWVDPHANDTEEQLSKTYASWYDAGIRGVFFEADSEKHFRIAKQHKIAAHRWMWTLNRGEKSLLSTHPEWYAINRKGESCATHPPYVDYYRWLCPSKEGVSQYLEQNVKEILAKPYIDGIHLDYVRFCDVILPVNLWEKYGIEQNKELPEYDFCYCSDCVKKFKDSHGIDILEVKHPDQSLSWRKFRYDAVTSLVNRLAVVAASYKKPITAAVFPTPEVAKRIVRQDWLNWNLDGICPMIYHGFYKEPVSWIGDAVAEGVKGIHGKFPLYAGLYLPDFKNEAEIKAGIETALKNGAAGVSIFGRVDEVVLKILKSVG